MNRPDNAHEVFRGIDWLLGPVSGLKTNALTVDSMESFYDQTDLAYLNLETYRAGIEEAAVQTHWDRCVDVVRTKGHADFLSLIAGLEARMDRLSRKTEFHSESREDRLVQLEVVETEAKHYGAERNVGDSLEDLDEGSSTHRSRGELRWSLVRDESRPLHQLSPFKFSVDGVRGTSVSPYVFRLAENSTWAEEVEACEEACRDMAHLGALVYRNTVEVRLLVARAVLEEFEVLGVAACWDERKRPSRYEMLARDSEVLAVCEAICRIPDDEREEIRSRSNLYDNAAENMTGWIGGQIRDLLRKATTQIHRTLPGAGRKSEDVQTRELAHVFTEAAKVVAAKGTE